MSEIELRASDAAEVVDVSYPKRIATVIVAPYETPAVVHTSRGSFTEVISRGAYDGVQRRAGSIRANRDHDWTRLAGRVTGLHPDRPEGLVAEVRMFKTAIGQETLELCAEEGLSVSAGFALMCENGSSGPVKRGAETWERARTLRRLNELWLDHVAFVPNPAYEGAQVLAVRAATDPPEEPPLVTPHLDEIRLGQLETQYTDMDVRYGLIR